jgi:hypothetical protein
MTESHPIRYDKFDLEQARAAGKNFARNQILDFIGQHLQEEVPITVEDVASEIEYIQRTEIREKNG